MMFRAKIDEETFADPEVRFALWYDTSDDGVKWQQRGGMIFRGHRRSKIEEERGTLPGIGTLAGERYRGKYVRARLENLSKTVEIGIDLET